MCYPIYFLLYSSCDCILTSSAYIFILRRKQDAGHSWGYHLNPYALHNYHFARYYHLRFYRFCPVIIHTSLYKGAIFTLLIRNISGISTDFNRSRRQLIERILDVAILLSYTIKDFVNIMQHIIYMTLLIYNTIKCLYLSIKIRPYLSLNRDALLREPNACSLLPFGMVVEPFLVQDLAADLRLFTVLRI